MNNICGFNLNIVESSPIYVFILLIFFSLIFYYFSFENNIIKHKQKNLLKELWLKFWGTGKKKEQQPEKKKLSDEELKAVEDELLRILKEEQPILWEDLERRTIQQIIDLIKKIEALKVPYWEQIIKYIKVYLKRVRGYIYKD